MNSTRVGIESTTVRYLNGANIETAGHLIRIEMHKKFGFEDGDFNVIDISILNALYYIHMICEYDLSCE
jgi:hypothetical protein